MSVAKRLGKLQLDFLWEEGTQPKKSHLVNWDVVCLEKNHGGLGLSKLHLLNRALLGKWIWRFVVDSDCSWKRTIQAKYGMEGLGWRFMEARGAWLME